MMLSYSIINKKLLFSLISISVLAGCTLGPDFSEPEIDHQNLNMSAKFETNQSSNEESLIGWRELYQDPHLQSLISKALANNFDLRIAQSKIIESRQTKRIAESVLWPSINANIVIQREGSNTSTENNLELKGLLAWELDLFGANKRASEAALAQHMAISEAKNAVELALIAQVAQQFFTLKQIEEELQISNNTIKLRAKELDLAKLRKASGVISGLEQRQAEVELESAKVNTPKLKHSRVIAINNLQLLIGTRLDSIEGGKGLSSQFMPKKLPNKLSSSLLERRPDVKKAEYEWHAAMAKIGVAKADLFPSFSLTSEIGNESSELSDLLSSNAFTWQLGVNALSPIFNAGKNLANLSATQERSYQANLNYQKVVLTALQEVSNEISTYATSEEAFAAQSRLVASTQAYFKLAQLRYRNGVASSLDLLDAQRSLFSAQIGLVNTKNARLQSMTRLYKALGGGWLDKSKPI